MFQHKKRIRSKEAAKENCQDRRMLSSAWREEREDSRPRAEDTRTLIILRERELKLNFFKRLTNVRWFFKDKFTFYNILLFA